MKLTGKDVYEALTAKKPWADVWGAMTTHRQKGYEEAATILNSSHIAPLQGLVEELQGQVEKLTADIKSLRGQDRAIFDDQDKQILALQGLVLEWQQWVKDSDDIPLDEHFKAEYEVAREQRAKLEERTRELCKKEQ